MLTINRLPQFSEQVTGAMRQMRPAIKCVAVDDRGDPKTADVVAGLIRYIENRSNAPEAIYPQAADSQVQAGIGHWKVTTEYADASTFNQEIRIAPVSDQLAVRWDPDALLPDRSDAMFAFEPWDLALEAFQERYPDKVPTNAFSDDEAQYFHDWMTDDYVRLAVYWCKKPCKRVLALLPDGGVDDLTDEKDPNKRAELEAAGARVEERDGHQVWRGVMTSDGWVEEPACWPGRHIPLVPVIGREIRMGRSTFRYGLLRFAQDPQRLLNFAESAKIEWLAGQPKAPWLVTDTNIAEFQTEWDNANSENLPYLRYTPDPTNGNKEPSRVPPPVGSPALADLVRDSAEALHAVTGIYPSSLGAPAAESSGRAIRAREEQGDTGSFVFTKNYGLALKRTAEIALDLIPHIYDTSRTIRVIGEDGKQDIVKINTPAGLEVEGAVEKIQHDVTVGAYDVAFEMGPSFTSKAAEAREGMTAMVTAAPNIAPIVLDLVAKAQDWPLADKFAKRLRTLLPPAIQLMEAEEEGDPSLAPKQAPPDPMQARLASIEEGKISLEELRLQVEGHKVGLERDKANLDAENHLITATAPMEQQGPDPEVVKLEEQVQGLEKALGEIDQVLEQVVKALQAAQEADAKAAANPKEPKPDPVLGELQGLRELLNAPRETSLEFDGEGNPVRSISRLQQQAPAAPQQAGAAPQQVFPAVPAAPIPADPELIGVDPTALQLQEQPTP
jgi:hypothetical protein